MRRVKGKETAQHSACTRTSFGASRLRWPVKRTSVRRLLEERVATNLDLRDIQVILAALKYSKRNIDKSPNHASYEQRQSNLREIEEVEAKIRSLRDGLRNA
jgi:hypothetical protein